MPKSRRVVYVRVLNMIIKTQNKEEGNIIWKWTQTVFMYIHEAGPTVTKTVNYNMEAETERHMYRDDTPHWWLIYVNSTNGKI